MTQPRRPTRKRAPRTNPELAVRKAERAIVQAMEEVPAAAEPAVEPPAVRVRDDDPPIYVEVWNGLYALEHGTHEEVVRRTR